jgi:DNA (cytosine-5)-methyltransferase 1
MKVLSLFSGVGGFDLGLERAGMETVFQCEWDKHATNILERHWPDVPRWGDVSTLTGRYILDHAPVIDVVAWGSPCQDLSVAGKRAGLQGARSGLFHEGIRIIKELRELTDGQYPRFSIWENVAGALSSSGGADFGQVLYEMDEAGACFSEWRLLDAQYFGVPQRRRRVFVVSVFDSGTAARCPDPLLPVSEGVRGDSSTGEPKGEEPANKTAAGTRNRGAIIGSDIVGPLAASDWKFPQQQQVHENKCVVETFTKGKRAQSVADDETWDEGRPAPTLNAFDQGDTRATTLVAAVAYSIREDAKANTFSATELDRANALSALRPSPQSHHAQMFIAESQMAVRRLTPVECERLMGWPDGWTDGQADSHRYKQCGNGVASPVAEWIGRQIINL